MKEGDRVEIKEHVGSGRWAFRGALGTVIDVDKHCCNVLPDKSNQIRDVREHFRRPRTKGR